MKIAKYIMTLAFMASFSFGTRGNCAEVRGWEGTIDLPTYVLGEEDPNPPFPLVNRRQIYPYTMLDDLTDRREMRTYKTIYLENDYLKAIILPELGGRLYSLFDKVSKREVFYRNNAVKYGLVALRGAWISGGIEFNFPSGHTVVTVSHVASRLLSISNGSAAAVVGGMDWVTGMHWEVALTLRAGQARLEQHVTLFNPTPLENPYWYWANAAVPATEDMQFIYPMREANPHSRTEIWTYPDWKDVDYSWYKNIRQPTSLFGRAVHRNFFGAYYHDSDYGVVHVADYHEVPGKKIWSWGVAGDGLIWTDLLTDHDGAYNEIQSGRYETQLNQEFLPPHCSESWTEYWYPVRGLGGGFVEATNELALNVNYFPAAGGEAQRVDVAFNPTEDIKGATIRVSTGGKLLREFGPVNLVPTETPKFSVPVENLEAAKKSLVVEVVGSDAVPMLHWSAADPIDGNKDFVPAAGVHERPEKPVAQMSVEELYLRGVAQEKDGKPEDAEETYKLVLKRDPQFIPALLRLVWRDYQAADFDAALAKIALAENRDNANPAVSYAAGVVYRAQGKLTQAQDAFWRSLQFHGSPAPSLAQLGEIAIQQRNYDEAERLLQQVLTYNPADALVLSELGAESRIGKRPRNVLPVPGNVRPIIPPLYGLLRSGDALTEMPLLPSALIELRLDTLSNMSPQTLADRYFQTPSHIDSWRFVFMTDVQNYLEVAAWYRSLGDLHWSDEILRAAAHDLPADRLSPMLYYYLAANAWQEGQDSQAREYVTKASSASHDKVFPQRLSDALVLKEVIAHDPNDAHAHYFLGAFLFAHGRYEDGAKEWLAAKSSGFDDSVLERNLGVYEWRVKKDLPQAAAYYEKAIQLVPGQYRLYPELDEIYTQLGETAKREQLFARAPIEVLDRDTVRVRRALLDIQKGEFKNALSLLNDHHYKPWEGGAIVRQIFVLANLTNGEAYLTAKNLVEAEHAFRRALEYPVNLGVGKPDQPHDEEAWYWLGNALALGGKSGEAQDAWKTAVKQGRASRGVSGIFAAGALMKLGQGDEAEKLLAAATAISRQPEASAQSLYVAGLAEHLRNHEAEAQKNFRRALELDPLLWQARFELDRSAGSTQALKDR